jgi:lysozyme
MYPLNHALALIKSFEHFSPVSYGEPNGTQSIGYGHNISPGESFGTITRAMAVQMLEDDIMRYALVVDSAISVPMSAEIFTALVSLTYNIGIGAFAGSDLLIKLNEGDYPGAANEFERWVHSAGKVLAGLVERRAIEQELFLSGNPNLSRSG